MLVLNLFISPDAINIVFEHLYNAQTNHKTVTSCCICERSIGVRPIIRNHRYNIKSTAADNSSVCVVTVVVDVVACRAGVTEVISNSLPAMPFLLRSGSQYAMTVKNNFVNERINYGPELSMSASQHYNS